MTLDEARKILRNWYSQAVETVASQCPKAWRFIRAGNDGEARADSKDRKAALEVAELVMRAEREALRDAVDECQAIRQAFVLANVPTTVPSASRQYYRDGYRAGAAALIDSVASRRASRTARLQELKDAQDMLAAARAANPKVAL